jgi:CBS domain-containing protein
MDRLSGHDEDEWRRGNDRNERDRDTQERYRSGDRSWQYGRSALRDRGQSEWSDLGRSNDERNRSGPSGDTGGSYERLQTVGYGRDDRQGGYQRDETRFGAGVQSPSGRGRYEAEESRHGQGPSFENRSGQSLGQRGLGRSPSESYGRDDSNRGGDRWAAERLERKSATAMSSGYQSSGGSYGFARDEDRLADWGEHSRDLDRGQGRRFWQREPLAARDVMTRNPRTVSRESAHREAAAIMRDENCGVVPVVDSAGRLEGILTDRDIVVRGVAHDRAHELRIEDVMTDDVSAVTEDEPLTSVLDLMGRKQVRRVPVVDRDDRLLGIISMADIANRADYDEDLQDAFERISSRRSFWSLFS